MPTNHGELLRTLSPDELHLWTVSTDHLGDSTAPYLLEGILSPDEKKLARRFHQAKDWHLFVVAHALLRLALSRYFPVSAGDWRFARGRNYKPFLTGPNVSEPPPQFSLSHTNELIACLITSSIAAAVDVEKVEYSYDLPLVARQVLSTAELRTLSNLSEKEWAARFFDYWTLKEAYAKARGLGLDLKFSDIDIKQGPNNAIRARFASSVRDDPSAWVFWHRRLPSSHAIAIAARKDFGGEVRLILRSVRFDGLSMAETVPPDEQSISAAAW